ncbi:type II toxin-antitoxin system HicB family antitoxin [Leuconostoc citreum]
MNKNSTLIYPVIMAEHNDEDGYVVTVSSPNIPGMHTEANSLSEAAYWSVDAIATMLDGNDEYPEPMDTKDWKLAENERVVYVPVNMKSWYQQNMSKTIKRSVTVPEYLNEMAKESNINVSRLLTEALEVKLGVQ